MIIHIPTKYAWRGVVTVTHRDLRNQVIKQERFDNLVTNVGLNMLRDVLRGTVTDGDIKYIAWGTDATAPAAGDTQLVAENGRKQVTQQTATTTGSVLTVSYIAPYEGNVSIRELGWFAGASASLTVNSGIMLARVLYSHDKNQLESIQVDREDTFAVS